MGADIDHQLCVQETVGGISGGTAANLINPLDGVKMRLQQVLWVILAI